MASRHQWRKYRIDYQEVWEVIVNRISEYGSHYLQSSKSILYSDSVVYTGFEFNKDNGKFILTNPKKADSVTSGDIGYFCFDFREDKYSKSYYKTGYSNKEYDVIYKFRINGKGNPVSSYDYDTVHYSWLVRSDYLEGIYHSRLKHIAKQGAYVGLVQGQEGEYPQNGQKDGYWYVYDKALNEAPTISGSDLDLGGVFKDVSVDYIIQDADGDSVEVKISLDGAIKQPFTQTTLGVRRTFNLPIKSVELGRHKLEIEARDSQGASSVRTYTFEKVNSAPIISGSDVNLGAKNTAFSYKYSIMDNESDNVKVVEKLNGSIIRTLYNVTLGQEQIITISDEQIREMELHKQNTIEIEASDGTATVYRRINFTRNNMPPIISDVDKDLGILTDKLEYKFSATDPEEDTMVYTVSLDDRILVDREPIPDGREKSILIEGMDWLKIRPTKHTIKIFVEDDKGFKSVRTITFTRRVDRIVVQLANKGIMTDEIANRVLVSDAGMYSAKGAITKIEVCNNSFDDAPTWEDATTMFKAGRAYNFQNKEKTAEEAGINIRVTIEKGESTAPSYITATGGSFD